MKDIWMLFLFLANTVCALLPGNTNLRVFNGFVAGLCVSSFIYDNLMR